METLRRVISCDIEEPPPLRFQCRKETLSSVFFENTWEQRPGAVISRFLCRSPYQIRR